VHPGRVIDLVEALRHVDLRAREDVYHACRALLVHRREDVDVFDRAFAAFFSALNAPGSRRGENRRRGASPAADTPRSRGTNAGAPEPAASRPRAAGIGPAAGDRDSAGEDVRALGAWSESARLAVKDFAAFTDEEIAAADAAMARLAWNPGTRRTRRWIAGGGPRLDVRRAIARSLRTAGDLAVLPRRARRRRPRRLVLVCDVSGSMERYSRMLLHFAHAMRRRHQRVEAFLFSTGLTRITRELGRPAIDDAMARVSRAVPDWSGGTRIGEALRALNRPGARHAIGGRPVLLLVSDGWDRGSPAMLAREMARLQRNCHRVVWLNPLIGTAGYEPLTEGLRAALPYVDDFLPARTLQDLADLARQLNALAARDMAAR
jgi:hypothetical protein